MRITEKNLWNAFDSLAYIVQAYEKRRGGGPSEILESESLEYAYDAACDLIFRQPAVAWACSSPLIKQSDEYFDAILEALPYIHEAAEARDNGNIKSTAEAIGIRDGALTLESLVSRSYLAWQRRSIRKCS